MNHPTRRRWFRALVASVVVVAAGLAALAPAAAASTTSAFASSQAYDLAISITHDAPPRDRHATAEIVSLPSTQSAPVAARGPFGVAAKAADELLALPKALRGGPANVHVYHGVRDGQNVYVGLTNDLARRQAQHGDRFVLVQITDTAVTRGEARAIEEALILRNPGFEHSRHSISPQHAYYQDAVDWGNAWLRKNGY